MYYIEGYFSLQDSNMQTSTDMALMPVNYEIQPVRGASNRGVGRYVNERDNFVRISFPDSKSSRVGRTYGRMGNEKERRGMGENVDLYV